MLNRIAAMLLALAGLAERAAGAPYPVRCLVLWALAQGDAVAREFVADATAQHWSPVVMSVRYGHDPADAMNLATSLRRLALVVQTLAAQVPVERPRHPDHAVPDGRWDNLLAAIVSKAIASSAPRCDTS